MIHISDVKNSLGKAQHSINRKEREFENLYEKIVFQRDKCKFTLKNINHR